MWGLNLRYLSLMWAFSWFLELVYWRKLLYYTLKNPLTIAVQSFEDLVIPNPSEIKSA